MRSCRSLAIITTDASITSEVPAAAEFSAGTGKLLVKRNNLNSLAPQEAR